MDKREIVVEMECDSDIASDMIAISHREELIGNINGGINMLRYAIAKIASEGSSRRHIQRGQYL